jgi:adenylate cyclase
MATITYQPDGVIEEDDLTLTLLQMAHKHNIPHVSACGGNARCSTCRVHIGAGQEHLLPRTQAELRLATLKGMEPDIRLACQTRTSGSVCVRRLVHDDCDMELADVDTCRSTGREIPLAVLFSDIRDFTTFAENHLPYDAVHILDRHFLRSGEAVLRHGGYIDKYMGDGMMALFGLECPTPAEACNRAVSAALDMLAALPELNRYLDDLFGCSLNIGIGIHFGSVLVGEIGHPSRRQFTAIGDVVNTASRIESANKALDTQLLISDEVLAQLDGKLRLGKRVEAALKGKHLPVTLHEVLGRNEEG